MISGLILSLLLSHSLWLDMRMNTSLVLPLCLFFGMGAGLCSKKVPHYGIVLLMQGILVFILGYVYGPDMGAWTVMPALIIREGLFLKFMDLCVINRLLVLLILLGNRILFPFNRFLKET